MSELVEVVIGVIGRAHGIRGEVVVEVRTDEIARRFAPGTRLQVGGRTLTLARARQASDRLIANFTEICDRDAAEQLRGNELVVQVPADEIPSGPDEYFDRQLIGLRVLAAGGSLAGEITAVLHGPAQDLLVVAAGGAERLVPFVSALVPVVDLDAGYVQLADVDGLIEDTTEDD